MAAQAFCAGLGRQHALCVFEKRAAGIVEIVGVLVVAEQDRIDRADRVGLQCGTDRLLQRHMRQLIGARRIEGRIGEQAEPVDLDQRSGAADQGDGNGHQKTPLTQTGFAGRVTR